jgi:hypothetical protein
MLTSILMQFVIIKQIVTILHKAIIMNFENFNLSLFSILTFMLDIYLTITLIFTFMLIITINHNFKMISIKVIKMSTIKLIISFTITTIFFN